MPEFARRWLFLLVIALAIPPIANSEAACPPEPTAPTPETLRAAAENARDRGFLWRISKDGRTSFLYGTMHVANLDWMFPGPKVTQALRAADTVALELDLFDPEIQNRMAKRIAELRAPALPDALARRVRMQMNALCVPPAGIDQLIPELQIAALILFAVRHEGLDASFAIDPALAMIGRRAGKDVVSLETPELQLEKLQMANRKETIAFVQGALDDLESGRALTQIARVSKVWAEADFAALEDFESWCECLETPIERKAMRRLLDERNPGLAERIDALHRNGQRVFAAVGSLHLFGKIGLPRLMAQRGYRVERVEYGDGRNGATNAPQRIQEERAVSR